MHVLEVFAPLAPKKKLRHHHSDISTQVLAREEADLWMLAGAKKHSAVVVTRHPVQ